LGNAGRSYLNGQLNSMANMVQYAHGGSMLEDTNTNAVRIHDQGRVSYTKNAPITFPHAHEAHMEVNETPTTNHDLEHIQECLSEPDTPTSFSQPNLLTRESIRIDGFTRPEIGNDTNVDSNPLQRAVKKARLA